MLFDNEARERVIEGVRKLSNAVKVTLGPNGNNVLLQGKDSPLVTNDGVTIARDIVLSDPVENMGCQLLKNAAIKTDKEVGDGTTTTIVLAEEILKCGLTEIQDGESPLQVRKEIEKDVEKTIRELKQQATPIETKEQKEMIAKVSCQNDNMAKVIANIIHEMGDNVDIVVEEQDKAGITYETIKGFQFKEGGEPKEIDDVVVVVYKKHLFSPHALYKEFEKIGNKPCLLICNMDEEVKEFFEKNNKKGSLNVTIVNCPADTKDLEGIEHVSKVRIEENKTTLFTDKGKNLAVIKLGADSDLELTEKMHRLNDALNATKQAVKHGVVMGGGVTLLSFGYENPYFTIRENMGMEDNMDYEVPDDVLDPVSVVIASLKNAASVAATFLTTEVIVYEDSSTNVDKSTQSPHQ